ncbi:tetratricopeptide repeat protein [Escherichia coli]
MNRYWLAIQQSDAALKANNPDRAERLFQQARNVDNTDSYAVLGLGDVAMARKDYPAAERYYQQTLRMDSGNTNAVRGLANITASNRQKKLKRLSPRSLPVSGVALMISNAACKTTVWHGGQRHWKTRANGRRRQHFSGNDWRWTRQHIDYLPTSQEFWQAGQRSQADTLMRNLAQQKSNDPEQVYAYGLYLSGHDQDERRWRISTACRVRSGTAIFRSWLIDCKAIRCWKPLTACEKAAKRQKRKRCCASNHLPRVLTSRWLTGRNNDVITPPPALHIRMS